MNQDHFLQLLRSALLSIREPHFFEAERAYQVELLAQLRARIEDAPLWPGSPDVLEEFQKSAAAQGLDIRPDMILHVSFDRGIFENRGQGDYAAIQVRRRADKRGAAADYDKLARVCSVLDYAMGIFINVDASEIFLPDHDSPAAARLHGFAVQLRADQVQIMEGHPYSSYR